MFVALPIEIKSREFDSRLYLAAKFLERNVSCVIGNKTEVTQYCYNSGEPYVYIAKSMSLNIYQNIKQSGGKFTILDEEGGVYFKDYEGTLDLRNPAQVFEYVDMYFSWGPIQHDFLLKNRKNIRKEKMLITGNPRFDLSKAEFAPYHLATSTVNSDFPNGYILVPTRFKRYNHQLGDDGQSRFVGHMRKNKAELYNKNRLYSEQRNKQDRDYQAELFTYFVEAVQTLAEKFPEEVVVLRPHPAENIKRYRDLFSSFSNVYVLRDGSILEWIAKAKVVIYHDCTTGIEAMFHGVPSISYTPVFDEDLIQWLPVMAGYRINKLETLVEVVTQHVIQNTNKEHFLSFYNNDLIKTFIANIEFNSADTIVDAIMDRKQDWDEKGWNCKKILVNETPSIIQRVLSKLSALTMMNSKMEEEKRQVKILKKNKFPGLAIEEIEARLKVFSEISGLKTPVSVQPVAKNTYLLKPR